MPHDPGSPASLSTPDLDRLALSLEEARRRGYLGPRPVETQIQHSLALAAAAGGVDRPDRAMDLGSGGGIPGLPMALAWSSTSWVLLEGGTSRAKFLQEAVRTLGLGPRVEVWGTRSEEAARGSARATFDLVVARGFGTPAATAECAAPFLRVGGRLLVSEPPGGSPGRWDPLGLAMLGMALGPSGGPPASYQVLEQTSLCPDRFPRRTGIPAKRPLFRGVGSCPGAQ